MKNQKEIKFNFVRGRMPLPDFHLYCNYYPPDYYEYIKAGYAPTYLKQRQKNVIYLGKIKDCEEAVKVISHEITHWIFDHTFPSDWRKLKGKRTQDVIDGKMKSIDFFCLYGDWEEDLANWSSGIPTSWEELKGKME